MNIHSKITDDSFPLLWKEIEKEGIEIKKVTRTNHAIAIFSQIFFAIAIMLFGLVVFYFIFKNDSEALFIQEQGAKLIQFLPETIPDIIKIIICLLLALVLPAVCCLFVRFVFSLFSAKYQNNDMGKDGLCGAKAIQKAINEFEKERTHYDITWDLPEHWAYHLIFSISFLLPVFIQLYLLLDKTNNQGIVGIVPLGGLAGLILLLPVAGLKAISNFLCNRTCFFLTHSKEKEYADAIRHLSNYVRKKKQQIKEEKGEIEEEEEKRNKKKQQDKRSQTSVSSEKPINEYDSFTWTNEYVRNNEGKCSDIALSILKVSKELLEEGDYSGAAAGFDKVVRALELLKNIDNEYYLPPLFANCYALSQIFAFGLNNKTSACKYAKKACEYAQKCNSDTARRDLAVMRDLYNALDSSSSISSILDEFDIDFPYDILRMN